MMFKTILVAVDGSGFATNAVRYAGNLAKTYNATLVLLAVDGQRTLKGALAELARDEDLSRKEIFERILSSAITMGAVPTGTKVEQSIGYGDPGDELLTEAERVGADLIVVGSRGLGAYAELLLGSVSRKVLHLAKVPVMVVHTDS
jgi:nucleotide-binding universal stress UspA family protein